LTIGSVQSTTFGATARPIARATADAASGLDTDASWKTVSGVTLLPRVLSATP
jgi:hypothetical protein